MPQPAPAPPKPAPTSLGGPRSQRLRLALGLGLVLGLVLAGILAPVLAPYGPQERDPAALLAPPSAQHLLGTDEEGRDVLSLLLFGARVALAVSLGTVLFSASLGTLLGLLSGYLGGLVDLVLQRAIEVILSFPGILLAILIIFVTGRPGVLSVVVALSATGWSSYARLVRGQVLSVRRRAYVEAARVLGLGLPRVLWRHVLPAVAGPVLVLMTFQVASTILAEAGLSFLGLGPQDGTSWGALLEAGAVLFVQTPIIGMSAGLAIALTVVGVNVVGDALRDRWAPGGGI